MSDSSFRDIDLKTDIPSLVFDFFDPLTNNCVEASGNDCAQIEDVAIMMVYMHLYGIRLPILHEFTSDGIHYMVLLWNNLFDESYSRAVEKIMSLTDAKISFIPDDNMAYILFGAIL